MGRLRHWVNPEAGCDFPDELSVRGSPRYSFSYSYSFSFFFFFG